MQNWAGNQKFGSNIVNFPSSLSDLSNILGQNKPYSIIGKNRSFTPLRRRDVTLISLENLPGSISIDFENLSCVIPANVSLIQVARHLESFGLSLLNYPSSLDFNTIGALLTGSHGSGATNGILASQVLNYKFMDTSGGVHSRVQNRENSSGILVDGWVNVLLEAEFRIMEARKFKRARMGNLLYSDITNIGKHLILKGYSTSINLGIHDETRNQLWIKEASAVFDQVLRDLFEISPRLKVGAAKSPGQTMTFDSSWIESGTPAEMIPHFGFAPLPEFGDELQSEYFFDLADFEQVIYAFLRFRKDISELCRTIELRTISSDEINFSPAFGRRTLAFHITWRNSPKKIPSLLRLVQKEFRLAGLTNYRVHVGKLFDFDELALIEKIELDSRIFRFDFNSDFIQEWKRTQFKPVVRFC